MSQHDQHTSYFYIPIHIPNYYKHGKWHGNIISRHQHNFLRCETITWALIHRWLSTISAKKKSYTKLRRSHHTLRLQESCISGKFHSILGDREKCRGTFKEFWWILKFPSWLAPQWFWPLFESWKEFVIFDADQAKTWENTESLNSSAVDAATAT